MMVSPGSNGMVLPSSLKVGMGRVLSPWAKFSLCVRDYLGERSRSARTPLVVTLAADHVQRTECRDDVAQHPALDELREASRDLETGRPDAHAVRRPTAVGDE